MPNKKYAKRLMWPESQKAGRAAVHCHRAINVDRCVHCQRGSGAWWKDPGRVLTPSRRIEGWPASSRCHIGGSDGKSPADKAYMAQMVTARTGLSQPEAEQRVDTVANQLNDAEQKVRQAADVARKPAAQLSIADALSMLSGAVIASAAAALGGRIRDEY